VCVCVSRKVAYLSPQICEVCVNLFVNFLLAISTLTKHENRKEPRFYIYYL